MPNFYEPSVLGRAINNYPDPSKKDNTITLFYFRPLENFFCLLVMSLGPKYEKLLS